VTTLERQVIMFLVPHIQLLQQMGYQVTVATSITNRDSLTEKLPNVRLYHLPFSRKIYSLTNVKAFLRIKQFLRTEQFNLMHVHSPIASFVSRLAAPKTLPIIYTAHGFHFNENGSKITNTLFYQAEKFVAKKTNRLIVMNEHDYQHALRFLTDERVHFINGIGIDSSYFNPNFYPVEVQQTIKKNLYIPEEIIVITHLAEFNENKRQIDVIKAAEKLKQITNNFLILLIGDGELLEQIKTEIASKNLSKHVRCLGFRTDIRDILGITDIGLLVSLREGLPKSIMEMMAMRIPVVVTDIRGNRELIKDKESGLIIPIKSPAELKKALLLLLENEAYRLGLGANGRNKILEKYDLRLILEETKMVYTSIGISPKIEEKVVIYHGGAK
jgi:glycosyltransferase involved in cell wall biosynthesis